MARPVFRALWIAQLGSNLGTWMQMVGAQWMLVSAPNAATLVPLVQTASLLPAVFLSLPAGILADALDRRGLLVAVQTGMAAAAAVLAVVTALGATDPAVLLLLLFILGCGQALAGPAWQAVQPELVPRAQIPAAVALGSMSINVARALGPAIGGVLVAWSGPTAVFAINAVSFAGVVAVLLAWHRPVATRTLRAERAVPALRAGTRYVRYAPIVRRLFLRSVLFVVPASALWALLPLAANGPLGLGSAGYGVLLGALGLGAVIGAVGLSGLRARHTANQVLAASSTVFAVACAVLGLVGDPIVVSATLLLAGAAWLAVLSTLNASLQLVLPEWVRARGLGAYMVVFMGGQALGSFLWGLIAGAAGLTATLLTATAGLVLCALSVLWWPVPAATEHLDRVPSLHWPEPMLLAEPDPDDGPVLVIKTYRVAPDRLAPFLTALDAVRESRRRTGAMDWSAYQDGADPERIVELFVVRSWGEHLSQHGGRLTGADRDLEAAAEALAQESPVVRHLFPPGTVTAPPP
jgi:MFS family permease